MMNVHEADYKPSVITLMVRDNIQTNGSATVRMETPFSRQV